MWVAFKIKISEGLLFIFQFLSPTSERTELSQRRKLSDCKKYYPRNCQQRTEDCEVLNCPMENLSAGKVRGAGAANILRFYPKFTKKNNFGAANLS